MIDLTYSLVIETTDDQSFFGFFSPDLQGFTGVGHSIEDCLYKARLGNVAILNEQRLPIPAQNPDPRVRVQSAEQVAPAA